MRARARTLTVACWTIAGLLGGGTLVRAHSGPPFPIVSNLIRGAYVISLWTDPDASDDGSAAGRFWVTVDAAQKGITLASDTRVTVSIRPIDRQGSVSAVTADTVGRDASQRFVALVLDHEGRYAVRVTIDGPLGPADVEAAVDATYDLRPGPIVLVLSLLPFALVGFLWLKVLRRRRHQ